MAPDRGYVLWADKPRNSKKLQILRVLLFLFFFSQRERKKNGAEMELYEVTTIRLRKRTRCRVRLVLEECRIMCGFRSAFFLTPSLVLQVLLFFEHLGLRKV